MNQIEEVIREKSENEEDAEELMELINTAFENNSALIRKIDRMKEGE